MPSPAALTWLREIGYLPCDFNGYRSRNNGNKSENNPQPSNGNGKQDHPENFCPIHLYEMKRWEKNGKVWYSHKVDGEVVPQYLQQGMARGRGR